MKAWVWGFLLGITCSGTVFGRTCFHTWAELENFLRNEEGMRPDKIQRTLGEIRAGLKHPEDLKGPEAAIITPGLQIQDPIGFDPVDWLKRTTDGGPDKNVRMTYPALRYLSLWGNHKDAIDVFGRLLLTDVHADWAVAKYFDRIRRTPKIWEEFEALGLRHPLAGI
jgi:hypothetical protein